MGRYLGYSLDNLKVSGLDGNISYGTSAVPKTKTSSGNINTGYVTTSHTSGDVRLTYQRLDFSAAGSGETLRAFSRATGTAVATGGTVNGAHISFSVNAGATVSGAGNALRATLGAATTGSPGGTLAAIQVDSDYGSGATPGTASFLRFTNSGNTALSYLAEVPTVASGALFAAHVTDAMTHSLRIRSAAGTTYYIMCTATSSNRTGGA